MSFSELGLTSDCLTTLEQAGYKEPTELQRQLIPLIKAGKNVLVKSQSASGKTGAFLIPAINYVLENPLEDYRGSRVLILTSRKDRVNQIKYTVKKLATSQNFRFGFIVSGRPYQPQMRLLRRPLDIMVATPGRLNDLAENGKADFSQLEMLIVDDLASIYHKEFHGLIDKILTQKTRDYPVILFVRSDDDVLSYAKTLIPDSVELEVEGEKHPLARIPQLLHICDDYTHKIAIMDYLLDEYNGESTLIYVSSDKSASHLADNLANHGHAVDIASKLSSDEQAESTCLIVSDESFSVLPSDEFKHVLHFEIAKSTTSYALRIEGKNWESRDEALITLLGIQERESLKNIEELIGIEIEKRTVPGLESLNPFSTFKPTFNASKKKSESHQSKRRNARQFGKRRTNSNDNRKKQSSQDDNKQRRTTKKGRFGRLSGGIHRKREEASTNASLKPKLSKKKQPLSNNKPRPASKGRNSNKLGKSSPSSPFNNKGRSNYSKHEGPSTRVARDNRGNRGSAFPIIKDPNDASTQQNNDEKKVVVRYKDKKRFLHRGNDDNA